MRVLADGAWGFASSRELSAAEIDQVTDQALRIARASALVSDEKVELGPPVSSQGGYRTPLQIDPFEVPLEEQPGAADGRRCRDGQGKGRAHPAQQPQPGVTHKYFANTEGAFTEQTMTETGGGIQATAVGNGEVQTRSYPNPSPASR